MKNEDLLAKFNKQLEEYAKVRGFIDKAKSQTDKFRPEVIEKVCLTHEVKSMELGETITPLVADIEAEISGFQSTIAEVSAAKAGSEEAMEELQLRLAIGELSEKDFDSESKDLKSELESADGNIGDAQGKLDEFNEALSKWLDLAGEAGHASGASEAPPAAQEAVVEVDEEPVEAAADSAELADAFGGSDEAADVDLAGGFGEGEVEVQEAEVEVASDEAAAEDDAPNLDWAPDEEDDAVPAEEAASVDELAPVDAEQILVEADEQAHEDSGVPGDGEDFLAGEQPVEDGGESLGQPDGETAAVNNGGAERRALLLYQEGTAEEQIYPFTNDEISIGRGRDNEIQIKNDSKVSRKHCILFRENDAFFIKDNKSSNGSLVNGELITERRLFGGEEIIIGETFFRFRIMD